MLRFIQKNHFARIFLAASSYKQKAVWLIIIPVLFFCSQVNAQTCCLTNSLTINTGYDPTTGTAITPGTDFGTPVPDPKWNVYSISAYEDSSVVAEAGLGAVLAVPVSSADVVTAYPGWINDMNSSWINCFNGTAIHTGVDTIYEMTFSRQFTLCTSACIQLYLNIASDNYVVGLYVDVIPTYPPTPGAAFWSQPNPGTFYGDYWFFSLLDSTCINLSAGTHTIYVTVGQDNVTQTGNAEGLNIYGTINSYDPATGTILINAIVSEAASCVGWSYCPEPGITGSSIVCVGGTDTLSDLYTGGTWSSSSTSKATVGASTGIVTGVSAGTVVITYTDPCGRTVEDTITVIGAPTISPTTPDICAGASIDLTGSLPVGTWSSSATTIASVGITSGVLYGMAGGTAIITFTNACGQASEHATVNALPAFTLSASSSFVCPGSADTIFGYTTDPGGGLHYDWLPSAYPCTTCPTMVFYPSVTTVYELVVTDTFGCHRGESVTVTVIPSPPITGTSELCVGTTVTLSDTLSGGETWSSSSTGIATVYSSVGIVTGVSAGIAVITYSGSHNCAAMDTIMVLAPPVAISGSTKVCVGSTTTLTDSSVGGTWSISNSTIATVDLTTGVVTGLTAGTDTITYTNLCGNISRAITVNPIPQSVTGPDSVCVGSTISLSDATTGGLWSVAPTSIATITTSGGVVTGVLGGIAVVEYTLSTHCFISDTITVNPLPPPLSATPGYVCIGDTLAITGASQSGGTWSSSNTLIATVVDSTGVVTGVSGGAVNITLTLPTGCFSVINVGVIPSPAPITGPDSVCIGDTIYINDATGGGNWSISSTVIATLTGDAVVGVSAGITVVTYTELPMGCYVTKTILVDSLPRISLITGVDTLCAGTTTTLVDSFGGGTWSSLNTLIATVDPSTGVVTGVSSGAVIIQYKITNSCGSVRKSQLVYVRPLPTVAPITGFAGLCIGTNDTLYDITTGGHWVSADGAIATITPMTGIATGVSTGLVNISYVVSNACGSTIVIKTLSVNMPPYITTNFVVACQTLGSVATDGIPPGLPTIESSAGCMYVCDSTTVRYYGNGPGSGSFAWEIIGGTIVTDYGDSVDVFWGIAGITGSVMLNDTISHCSGEDSICIQVIQKPEANFSKSAASICLNSTIYFHDLSIADPSSPIVSWNWYFGDGSFSSETNPSHTYTATGTDTVILIVKNVCGCADTLREVDSVSNTPGPVIICASIVCDSQNATYSTIPPPGCSSYDWSVVGGTIISGAGTASIVVKWNDIGPDGMGYVSLVEPDCMGICNDTTTIKIPVVMQSPVISGPATVCAGAQVEFSLPLWPATTYSWGVIGCPGCIVTTRNNNTIALQFPVAQTYTVHAWYQNNIKLCGGSADAVINVLPVTDITGNEMICENSYPTYALGDGLATTWTLKYAATGVVDSTYTGTTFTYSFPAAGLYVLSASGGSCANPRTLHVSALPGALSTFSGPDTVCLNRAYSYSAGGFDATSAPQWGIVGGTLYPASGYNVNVVWTSTGTKMLTSCRRSENPPYCTGPVDTMYVTEEATSSSLSGDTAVCSNTYEGYTCNYTRGESYTWKVVPSTAGSVFATDNSPTAGVAWWNVTVPITAYVTLAIHKCDSVYNDTLAVRVSPEPGVSLAGPATACPGTIAVFGASPGDSVYLWNFGGGTGSIVGPDTMEWVVPVNATTGDVSYNINVLAIPSVTNTGCVPVSDTSITISVLPAPVANVSASAWYLCTGTDSALLTATVTNNVSVLSYQWYRNYGEITGATDTTYRVGDRYPYFFGVMASDGCIVYSNIVAEDTCGTGSTSCSIPMSASAAVSCDTVFLTGSTHAGGTDYTWSVGASTFHSPLDSPAVTVVFDTPGVYYFAYSFTDTCGTMVKLLNTTVGLVAGFLYEEKCGVGATDSVLLHDHTAYLPGWSVDTIYWFNGATLLGTGSNINLVEAAPGSITITQVVHYHGPDGYATCQYTHTIVLPEPPIAFFSGDFIYGPTCEGNLVLLIGGCTGGADKFLWDFGDSTHSTLSTVEKSFTWTGPGNPHGFPVTLTGEDTLGCTASYTDTVWVYENLLLGNLGSNQTLCSNDAPVILHWIPAPITGVDIPNRFAWSNGVTNTTGIDTITQSGAYWVNVSDTATLCQKVLPFPDVQITIIPMPTAEFMGLKNYCIGDSIQLYSDAGNGIALQWYRNDTTDGTGIDINDKNLPVGMYDYWLTASVTEADSTCADTSAVDSTHIYAFPPAPVITGPVSLDCSTYLLQLTATEPMDGTYNWSNGAYSATSGTYGAVDSMHAGGPYRVWFTDLQGCISHADAYVPLSPEQFFAYLPTGCYTLCAQQMPLTLYGPPASDTFGYWAWVHNGDTLSSGSGSVMPPLAIDSNGSYMWYLSNGGCGLLSDTMNVTIVGCNCSPVPINATFTCILDSPARYYVTISSISPGDSTAWTVGTNIGPISPSSGILPTAGPFTITDTFTTLVITSPFPDSVTIEILYTYLDGLTCYQETRMPLDSCHWTMSERMSGDTVKHAQATIIRSAMHVFPNPTSGEVTISYNYGTDTYLERSISIYDEMGRKVANTALQDVQGNWILNTDDWTPGIYIIRMEADGKALQTQRMVVVSK